MFGRVLINFKHSTEESYRLMKIVLKYYAWVALFLIVGAVWLIQVLALPNPMTQFIGALGIVLGFTYFAQQQHLEETRLFLELFTRFNERYNKLSEQLSNAVKSLDNEAKKKIVIDYFNLCAEEYLFYKEGFIYPYVWNTWCRGMLQYLEKGSVLELWNEESKTESYYGLTLGLMRKSARKRRNVGQ